MLLASGIPSGTRNDEALPGRASAAKPCVSSGEELEG